MRMRTMNEQVPTFKTCCPHLVIETGFSFMISLHVGNCFREKSKESQYGSDARAWKGH